jgi:cell division septum initiation protein DivIVA
VRKVDDIMSNNAKKDGVVVLGEREFKRVKNGLDEAQVASFIDELIKERDKLAQSQDHIASLNKLAEMTVVEADRLATQVKTEATEQAKAESTVIIDKAREQAGQMMEKKIAEAVEIANEKANVIKAKAEEEAVLLIENERNKIRGELRNLVNQQFGYMLEELENLKQRAEAVQADFGNKLSAPREDDSAVTVETAKERDTLVAEIAEEKDAAAVKITEEIDATATEIPEDSDTLVAEIAEEKDAAAVEIAQETDAAAAGIVENSDTLVAEIAEEKDAAAVKIAQEIDAAAAEITEESDTLVAEQSQALDKHPAPSRATDHIEKSLDLSKLLEFEDQAELSKPQWEVEILPPFDIAKIMEVVAFLDQLPEVANTEMIVPQIDMPSILVFLRGSLNLVEVLQTVPAVAHVEEVTTDKAATNGEPGKGPRKIRISLSGNTTSQENK